MIDMFLLFTVVTCWGRVSEFQDYLSQYCVSGHSFDFFGYIYP